MSMTLILKVRLQSHKVYDRAIELLDPKNMRNKNKYNALAHIPQDMFMRLHFVSFLHLPRDVQDHVWRHHSDARIQYWCRFEVDIQIIEVIKFQHHIHKGLVVISIFRALGSTWTPEHQLNVIIQFPIYLPLWRYIHSKYFDMFRRWKSCWEVRVFE